MANLCFVGAGNMANAIIKGVTASKVIPNENIFVFDIFQEKAEQTAKNYNINACSSADELIEKADIVILAIKPNVFPEFLPQNAEKLKNKNPLIISIAAGKTIDFISNLLGYNAHLVRVMPNVNAKVSAAMCAYCCNDNVSDAQKAEVEKIFNATGKIIPLEEKYFPVFGVIAGCAPAYAYMFIDSLARAAVKNGMNKKIALEIAAQTVLGSAKLILESDEHPWELVDQVCSPGGTTIEGVTSLQADGFEAAVTNAVDAAVEKDSRI
ncbi:MAG: pyrroline-5-carboxylate reductase [Clostridiales bacterium]|nr:pyrroline-5-carboxylate reductase [Clostridiales bacterium]